MTRSQVQTLQGPQKKTKKYFVNQKSFCNFVSQQDGGADLSQVEGRFPTLEFFEINGVVAQQVEQWVETPRATWFDSRSHHKNGKLLTEVRLARMKGTLTLWE